MNIIVETEEEFKFFLEKFKTQRSFVLPYLIDPRLHSVVNELSLLWVYFIDLKEGNILSFNHNESLPLPLNFIDLLETSKLCLTLDRKTLLHKIKKLHTVDLGSAQYLATNKPLELEDTISPVQKEMVQKYWNYLNVNKAVPIMKILETFEAQTKLALSLFEQHNSLIETNAFDFINNVALVSLGQIEESGLEVNPEGFLTHSRAKLGRLVKDGKVYSDYNLYTTAGRPSNRFGGVNFAALNKTDGTRESFISRYEKDGILVSIDFESFHPRLIADLIGYQLPDEPFHEFMGKQYFQSNILTKEQYDESKIKTFHFMYGDGGDNFPFFQKVYEYRDKLWSEMETVGFIQSPKYGKSIKLEHINEPSPAKVFNYQIQLTETEYNLTKLKNINSMLENTSCCVILYTYDSILIDVHIDDIKLLKSVIEELEEGGKFPVRIYQGNNYQNMEKIERK